MYKINSCNGIILMKKQLILNLFIVLTPIVLVLVVNEYYRGVIKEKGFVRKKITAINSAIKTPKKCSWYCHNTTTYCKTHHTVLLKKQISIIDPIYNKIIKGLHAVGNYGLANIVFLVILLPLFMYLLFIKIISIQNKIKTLKNK